MRSLVFFSSQTNAEALSVSLDGGAPLGNVYSYSITLENSESIDTLDTLVFLDLADVTNATTSSPFQIDGFSNEDANFSVTANTSGSQTLSSVIQNGSVNLTKWSVYTPCHVQYAQSKQRRIQRWLNNS